MDELQNLQRKEKTMTPTAKCEICGKVYHGWALKYQPCKCCGKVLKVKS